MSVIKLHKSTVYEIKAPENYLRAMREDVALLKQHKKYLSLTTIVLCCLDALGAGPHKATDKTFAAFVQRHFPQLDADLGRLCPGKAGALTLYHRFRNGFAHERSPNKSFAIAEDHEIGGSWVSKIDVDGKIAIALNVDRLTREFLVLLDSLEKSQIPVGTTTEGGT